MYFEQRLKLVDEESEVFVHRELPPSTTDLMKTEMPAFLYHIMPKVTLKHVIKYGQFTGKYEAIRYFSGY